MPSSLWFSNNNRCQTKLLCYYDKRCLQKSKKSVSFLNLLVVYGMVQYLRPHMNHTQKEDWPSYAKNSSSFLPRLVGERGKAPQYIVHCQSYLIQISISLGSLQTIFRVFRWTKSLPSYPI